MKTKKIWVVVANSNQARIFQVQQPKKLIELETLEHPESRLPERELVGDKPGRGFESSYQPARHSMEPKTSPKRTEFINFARTLSHHLETARQKGHFESLYLAANPTFLGLLRDSLSATVLEQVMEQIDKDLTQLKIDDIGNHFHFHH